MSITANDVGTHLAIPETLVESIWTKASQLLAETNGVIAAPGGHGYVVKSFSGSRPHFIAVKKNGQFNCDNECGNWRSLGICAHSVAASEKSGKLKQFIEWYKKSKKTPNLTKLATTKMPAGRGRKGSVAPPKKKKKVEAMGRVSFADVCGLSQPLHEYQFSEDSSDDSNFRRLKLWGV